MIACAAVSRGVKTVARFIIALALVMAVAAPVLAAERADDPQVMERAQKKKDAEATEKEYNTTIKATGTNASSSRSDPWQNMRGGGDDSKTKR